MSGEGNHQYGLTGDKNSSFKGGRFVDSKGYVRVLCPDHPNADSTGYVKEHILIMSFLLGRPLNTSIEVVHHKDEDKQNNDPDNLELLIKGVHTSLHNRQLYILRDDSGRFLRVIKRTPIILGGIINAGK